MKYKTATKKAIKEFNKAKHKLFQARAQAQRDGLYRGQKGYPYGWLDTRNFAFRLFSA